MTYQEIVERRRALRIDGYATLANADFDGPYITPYQISSCSPDGPVLVAYNWFDLPSAIRHQEILKRLGYMPGVNFNKVMDIALDIAKMNRADIYMTQAFHLLPAKRSQTIRAKDVDISFDAITRHELVDRRVIALGVAAAGACKRHGVKVAEVCHPSARGAGLTFDAKAAELAKALLEANL